MMLIPFKGPWRWPPHWLPSNRVLTAAFLTGVVTGTSVYAGYDNPSKGQILSAIGIGLGAFLATILVEEVIHAAVTRPRPDKRRPEISKRTNNRWDRRIWRAVRAVNLRRVSEMRRRLRLVVRPEIAPLPEKQTVLRQRPQVVDDLSDKHEKQRRSRPSHRFLRFSRRKREQIEESTPVVICVHGKPGCGKSEIAIALAHRLRDQYPGGEIYINMGTAGGAKPAAEILKACLDALKWPEREIPPDTADRLKVMRSLTKNRRILFLFDAVRHMNQLQQVLPVGSGCLVIVTSRRDLGAAMPGTVSYLLEEPDMDESLDILRAAAQAPDESRSLAAAQIVEFCGHLPLALRSAGERAAAGADLADVADLLRDERSRLDFLDTENRKVKDRISSEYSRLLPLERRALQWLTLVPSPTFEARVLPLLMRTRPEEAENTLAYLAEVRLLDTVEMTSAGVRYRFNPLVKLLAQQDFQAKDEERADALRRWDEDLMLQLEQHLAAYEEQSTDHPGAGWLNVVRAEYHGVIRVIRHAHTRGRWATCWKIAARAGGCVPGDIALDEALEAFEYGVDAAKKDHSLLGEADVRLAIASMLIEVERYREAFALLDHVAGLAVEESRTAGEDGKAWQLRHGIVHRKRAEAYLQAASYQLAEEELRRACAWADACADETELRLLRMLRAEFHHINVAAPSLEELGDDRVDDVTRYRSNLILSEAERRLEHWQTASEPLETELRRSVGDLRRLASLHYRLARLSLHQWSTASAPYGTEDLRRSREQSEERKALTKLAVRRATDSLMAFTRIDDIAGGIRARCLLARALIADKLFVEAQLESEQAASLLVKHIDPGDIAYEPLRARILRARGELNLRRGQAAAGFRDLLAASRIFAATKDWSSQTAVNQLLGANEHATSGDWGGIAMLAAAQVSSQPSIPYQPAAAQRSVEKHCCA